MELPVTKADKAEKNTMRASAIGIATLMFAALMAESVDAVGYIVTDLGTLGGTVTNVRGVNDSGQAVGEASIAGDTAFHAFLCSNGNIIDLGVLGGTGSSTAYDINNSGQIVGSSITNGNVVGHAFLYSNGHMSDLGTLGGSNSEAHSINSSGQIVGQSQTTGNSATHAFLYANGHMTDLGTLGGTFSTALSTAHLNNCRGY